MVMETTIALLGECLLRFIIPQRWALSPIPPNRLRHSVQIALKLWGRPPPNGVRRFVASPHPNASAVARCPIAGRGVSFFGDWATRGTFCQ